MAPDPGPALALPRIPAVLTVALAASAILMAGCGGDAALLPGQQRGSVTAASSGPIPGFGTTAIPTPGPTGAAPDPAAVKIIEAWSTALRHGDVRTAAALFRLPSELIAGVAADGAPALVMIRSRAQAKAATETLPCGARFISADQRGRYVNALFRLTGRPGPGGSDCGSGAGATARTNFVIQGGRIVEWIRAPDDPGDNGSPGAPQGNFGSNPLV